VGLVGFLADAGVTKKTADILKNSTGRQKVNAFGPTCSCGALHFTDM
jgi:hypothetical protein